MKNFFKGLLITLLVVAIIIGLFIGFSCLCRWQGWLPKYVDWVLKLFDNLGISFLKNIKPV